MPSGEFGEEVVESEAAANEGAVAPAEAVEEGVDALGVEAGVPKATVMVDEAGKFVRFGRAEPGGEGGVGEEGLVDAVDEDGHGLVPSLDLVLRDTG